MEYTVTLNVIIYPPEDTTNTISAKPINSSFQETNPFKARRKAFDFYLEQENSMWNKWYDLLTDDQRALILVEDPIYEMWCSIECVDDNERFQIFISDYHPRMFISGLLLEYELYLKKGFNPERYNCHCTLWIGTEGKHIKEMTQDNVNQQFQDFVILDTPIIKGKCFLYFSRNDLDKLQNEYEENYRDLRFSPEKLEKAVIQESIHQEYKKSFLDGKLVKDGNTDFYDKLSITISAFINTEGGSIIFGIDDHTSEVVGIETDINFLKKLNPVKRPEDLLMQQLEVFLKKYIHINFRSNIRPMIREYDDQHKLFEIKLTRNKTASFPLEGRYKDTYYIRGNGENIRLDTKEAIKYIQSREL